MSQKNKQQNIGMLRQWLNEDRITDPNKMVTNEQIEHWLSEPVKQDFVKLQKCPDHSDHKYCDCQCNCQPVKPLQQAQGEQEYSCGVYGTNHTANCKLLPIQPSTQGKQNNKGWVQDIADSFNKRLREEQSEEEKDYTHDAPSLLWRIYDLVQADEVFHAESLIYGTLEKARQQERERIVEEIKTLMEGHNFDVEYLDKFRKYLSEKLEQIK